ncbi:MAG: FHA domain-containing protein, partial [Gemmatimonadaceae bacterium]
MVRRAARSSGGWGSGILRHPDRSRKARVPGCQGQSPDPLASVIFRPMPFRLTSTAGDQSFELQDGATLVVGRASASDLPVFDPTISRRHAELTCDGIKM